MTPSDPLLKRRLGDRVAVTERAQDGGVQVGSGVGAERSGFRKLAGQTAGRPRREMPGQSVLAALRDTGTPLPGSCEGRRRAGGQHSADTLTDRQGPAGRYPPRFHSGSIELSPYAPPAQRFASESRCMSCGRGTATVLPPAQARVLTRRFSVPGRNVTVVLGCVPRRPF